MPGEASVSAGSKGVTYYRSRHDRATHQSIDAAIVQIVEREHLEVLVLFFELALWEFDIGGAWYRLILWRTYDLTG